MNTPIEAVTAMPDWKQAIAARQRPILSSSIWQLVNSLGPYIALWGLMIWTLGISYWLTLALAVLAAGFLTRMFIIFHDCAHGSFLESRRGNRILEFITGVLTFTPYRQWRRKHILHHATSSDLDRRGMGDIWTLTVDEYLDAPRWKRLSYRVVRSPLVLFVVAPLYLFLIHHRIPSPAVGKHDRRGVHWTNLAILVVAVVMSLTIGIKAYLLIQLPVLLVAGMVGIWLFYVQHQFPGAYWERRKEWDFAEAALRGSSFYKLPRVLQWFSGNIGFHHIHHLSPAIPNYSLEKCHRENAVFRKVRPITLWAGFRALSYRLWDEQRKRFVSFGKFRMMRRERCSL